METDLLERGPIQVELGHLLHEAASGRGRLVFLGGEAGVGKTSLIQRFGRVMAEQARVLAGACDPLTTPEPLGPLLDMSEDLSGRYRALLEEGPDRNALFRGFLDELSGGGTPTLAMVEDVHWADEATLDLLRFLGRRLDGVPALVLATYRNDELREDHALRLVLGDLATLPSVHRLTVNPLSLEAVRTLTSGTALDPERLHRQAGGNPFFVTEVIGAGGEGIPATVRDAVLARAARLPPEARATLDAAAVLGSRFEVSLLETVAEPPAGAVEACVAGGLLRADRAHLAFRHELAREALLDALSPQEARPLHRAALEALRSMPARPADVGRLAHHAEGAGDAEAVLEYAPEAARRAASFSSHREAVAQYERALRFADGLPGKERGRLLERYAQECRIIDEHEKAIDAGRELIALWHEEGDGLEEGRSLTLLSASLVAMGRNAEAEEASRAAIEVLERHPPGARLAEAYAGQAALRMLDRDNAEAVAWGERALAVAEPAGDVESQIVAYNRMGSAKLVGGDEEEGRDLLERSLRLAREAGMHHHVGHAYLNLGSACGERFMLRPAQRYLGEGVEHAGAHELQSHRTYMRAWQALVFLHLGRWADAEEAAREVTGRSTASAISRTMALVALGRLKVRRGEEDAWEVLDEALALALPTATLQRLAPVRAARAEAAWMAGDPDRVREEARSVLDLAISHEHAWFAGELLAWLARAGDPEPPPEWIARPFALEVAGAWAKAAEAWSRLECPYEAARALAETGEPAPLRRALDGFRGLEARPLARATEQKLRRLGVRNLPRGPRPSTASNPANLTRRELSVLKELAEGRSNVEIAKRLSISPKTVDKHVSAVLSKLGVGSRTEAAREAFHRGIVEGVGAEGRKPTSQDGEPRSPR